MPSSVSLPQLLASDAEHLADLSLSGQPLSRDEARRVLQWPDDELDSLLDATLRVRERYFGRRVKMCVLLNAQSGICPEDCGYCSQSKISTAPVQKYKLLPEDTIVQRAKDAASTGARRFCIVIAARGPQARDIAHLSGAIRRIKSDSDTRHLEICTSLGLMSLEQCRELQAAGVDYVNHNLNTGEDFYDKICSTHTYQDRLNTIDNVKQAGLHTCSGGIMGLGESSEDLLDMAFALRERDIESIPLNFLLSIDGTPLHGRPAVRAEDGLKALCLLRLLCPDKEIRVAAGRETLGQGREEQALCAANSLFVDGYLTTPGDASQSVRQWIETAGYEVESAES